MAGLFYLRRQKMDMFIIYTAPDTIVATGT